MIHSTVYASAIWRLKTVKQILEALRWAQIFSKIILYSIVFSVMTSVSRAVCVWAQSCILLPRLPSCLLELLYFFRHPKNEKPQFSRCALCQPGTSCRTSTVAGRDSVLQGGTTFWADKANIRHHSWSECSPPHCLFFMSLVNCALCVFQDCFLVFPINVIILNLHFPCQSSS